MKPNAQLCRPLGFLLMCYIIPPMPTPAGIAGVSSLMFATQLSVVRNVDATLVAFCRALLVTFAGSRMPASTMFTYSSFSASKPTPGSLSLTLLMITAPSSPAFAEIWNRGASSAFRITFTPVFSSPSVVSSSFATCLVAWIYADPPPAMIPYSTAALVAARASSIRSFASFISVSVAAPTRITATPPASLASLSCSFSRSKSDLVSSICARI